MAISVSTRIEDNIGFVSFAGSLTLGPGLNTQAESVRDFIKASTIAGVILLLNEVSRVDTSGLGHLTAIYTVASKRGYPVRIVGARPEFVRVLEMTRLDGLLPCSPDLETAKAEMPAKAKPASPGM